MPKTKAFQIRMTPEKWTIIQGFAARGGLPVADVMIEGTLRDIALQEKILDQLSKNLERGKKRK